MCHTNSAKLVGKAALFNVPGVYAFSNHLTRLRVAPGVIDPQWLWRVMATLWRERYFENRCKQWVNQATIERATLLAAPVPLPPLPEQQRIVARIESLFAESRTARAALERVPALLKRFRQSVLASAFRGEESQDWEWTTIDEIAEKVTDGTHFTPTYVASGVPFISVKDIYGGKVHFDKCKYIPKEEHKKLFARCKPEYGDVLITKSGTIGRIAIVRTKEEFSLFVSVALVKPRKEIIDSVFLAFALENYINGINIEQDITGGVIKNLHIEDLKKVPIQLPPLAEQRRIVAKIESLFARADAIERAVAIARQRADKIDQSILARAFRGEL